MTHFPKRPDEEIVSPSKKRVMSMSEAQVVARKIYADLQARRKAARLAEAEYWKFLDEEPEAE